MQENLDTEAIKTIYERAERELSNVNVVLTSQSVSDIDVCIAALSDILGNVAEVMNYCKDEAEKWNSKKRSVDSLIQSLKYGRSNLKRRRQVLRDEIYTQRI